MNQQVIIDKNIRHGKPIIKGTRVTVEEILGALAGGMTYKEIEKEYSIKRDEILAAIRYATAWFQNEEVRSFVKARL